MASFLLIIIYETRIPACHALINNTAFIPIVFSHRDTGCIPVIGETGKNAADAFVEPAASSLMFALQMLVLTGVTLYITMTGYTISTGAVESPFWTFVKPCAKIIIIAFFALMADGYETYSSGYVSSFICNKLHYMCILLQDRKIYRFL